MKIQDFLDESHILPAKNLTSQKAILREISNIAATRTGIDEREICQRLYAREHIGSTEIGDGVAMPHTKLDGLNQTHLFLYINAEPVSYEAPDDQRVDIFFCLLIASESRSEHLQIMANIARMMRDKDLCNSLRHADTREAVYSLLVNQHTSHDKVTQNHTLKGQYANAN